jgi:hypothetical protein
MRRTRPRKQATLTHAISPNSKVAHYTIVSKIAADDMGEVCLVRPLLNAENLVILETCLSKLTHR